jgi:hypothetical protein
MCSSSGGHTVPFRCIKPLSGSVNFQHPNFVCHHSGRLHLAGKSELCSFVLPLHSDTVQSRGISLLVAFIAFPSNRCCS